MHFCDGFFSFLHTKVWRFLAEGKDSRLDYSLFYIYYCLKLKLMLSQIEIYAHVVQNWNVCCLKLKLMLSQIETYVVSNWNLCSCCPKLKRMLSQIETYVVSNWNLCCLKLKFMLMSTYSMFDFGCMFYVFQDYPKLSKRYYTLIEVIVEHHIDHVCNLDPQVRMFFNLAAILINFDQNPTLSKFQKIWIYYFQVFLYIISTVSEGLTALGKSFLKV